MKRNLGIILLLNNDKKTDENVRLLECFFRNMDIEILYIKCDKRDFINKIYEEIKKNYKQYKGVFFLNSNLFGPFYSDTNIINEIEEYNYDFWTEIVLEQFINGIKISRLSTDFLYIRFSENIIEELFSLLLNANSESDVGRIIYEYIITKRYNLGTLTKIKEDTRSLKEVYNEEYYRIHELLIDKKSRFISKNMFYNYRLLKYSYQDYFIKCLDYIRNRTEYNENIILEFLIENMNLYDIKNILCLEYIVSDEKKIINKTEKIGFFFHMYYEDLFEEYIYYIRKSSLMGDIYISTKEENIPYYKQVLEKEKIYGVKILPAGKKGRDAGALLVSFRKYILEYEYICFVHDKKTSGGIGPSLEGKTFMDLTFDNLLSNVEDIIDLFKKDSKLGFLSPPIPMMGNYLSSVVGNSWTVCFEETKSLEEKLGININIAVDKPVFALSTMFWCKVDSLLPIFEYAWSYDDFLDEPIMLDGTINHAIERSLIYIAQSCGFYSGIVYTNKYASLYLNNTMFLLDSLLGSLHKSNVLEIKIPFDFKEAIDSILELKEFCDLHKKIYIYGAGAQSKIIKNKLDLLNIKFEYFIVTEKKINSEISDDYKVEEFYNVKDSIKREDGIIVAMSRNFQEEVIPILKKHNFEYYCIKE